LATFTLFPSIPVNAALSNRHFITTTGIIVFIATAARWVVRAGRHFDVFFLLPQYFVAAPSNARLITTAAALLIQGHLITMNIEV
jgi:hypothetical protein